MKLPARGLDGTAIFLLLAIAQMLVILPIIRASSAALSANAKLLMEKELVVGEVGVWLRSLGSSQHPVLAPATPEILHKPEVESISQRTRELRCVVSLFSFQVPTHH